jgi:two-component system OmpR family response regulator
MTLQIGSEMRKLSSKESELLHILSENKNELVQRNVILEKVWGNDDYFSAKSMDVYISKIRKMLKNDPSVEILNAYGVGFKMIINE